MGMISAVISFLPPSATLLVCALSLGLFWVYQSIWLRFVHRRPGEPPLLSGTIPWWGCAATFGENPCQFVRDMAKKHGAAYTVVAAGSRVLLLCDYRHVKAVLKQSKTLSASELKLQMAARVFGDRVVIAERLLEEETRSAYVKYLAGHELNRLSSSYQDVLRSTLGLPEVQGCQEARRNPFDIESELDIGPTNTQWQTVDLSQLVAMTGFASAVDAVFGDGAFSPTTFEDYLQFDENFLLMLGGLPSWLPAVAGSLRARDRLMRQLSQKRKNPSALMTFRQEQFLHSSGLAKEDLVSHNVAFLFGLVANTSPAQFWTLVMLLRHQDAMAEVSEEIKRSLGDGWTREPAERHLCRDPDILRDQLKSMVKLESVVNEMFRTCSAPLVGRIALEDTVLELPEGPVHIRKDDRVCLVTHTIHHEENIYGRSGLGDFRWDRHLNDEATGPRKFQEVDTGSSVQHNLMPFGGGVSLCPGRHFARDEIKIFVATFLACFDVETLDADQPAPKFDFARSTIGVIPPVRGDKYMVRLRRRTAEE